MQINEKITINLTPEDVQGIIKEYLTNKGYDVKSVSFDVKERCEGWSQSEMYVRYFAGANCNVERNQ